MADSPKSIARRKWGRFLPHQRANVDQVPLPFVNDMETTYEQVGEIEPIAWGCTHSSGCGYGFLRVGLGSSVVS